MANTHNIQRLPVWAQNLVEGLQRDLKSVTEDRDRLLTALSRDSPAPENARVFISRHDMDKVTPLRNEEQIMFRVNRNPYSYVRAYLDGDKLTVMSYNGKITIRPQAANTVHITQEDY